MMTTFALEDGRGLYGSERLELLHEGEWSSSRQVILAPEACWCSSLILPKTTIVLIPGQSVVRKVSQPYGDAQGFSG